MMLLNASDSQRALTMMSPASKKKLSRPRQRIKPAGKLCELLGPKQRKI